MQKLIKIYNQIIPHLSRQEIESLREDPNYILERPENIRVRTLRNANLQMIRKHIKFIDTVPYLDSLQIVPREDQSNILRTIYKDALTMAAGRDSLYYRVIEKYVGISKRDVVDFLRTQVSYNLHIPRKKRSRPQKYTVSTAPMKYWQIDITYLNELQSKNKNIPYLLTCIDVFSKYAWAVALKNKTRAAVFDALKKIFTECGEVPGTIQTDRGTEFKGMLSAALPISFYYFSIKQDDGSESKLHHHVVSSAYTSRSQGCVERFNATFKSLIYHYLTEHKTKKWYDHLSDFLQNYNRRRHAITKFNPWDVHMNRDNEEMMKQVKANLEKHHSRRISNLNTQYDFKVGDFVRILRKKTTTKKDKDHYGKVRVYKGYQRQWSISVYQITKIYHFENIAFANQYQVKRYTSVKVIKNSKIELKPKKKRVFASQMLNVNTEKGNHKVVFDNQVSKYKVAKRVTMDNQNGYLEDDSFMSIIYAFNDFLSKLPKAEFLKQLRSTPFYLHIVDLDNLQAILSVVPFHSVFVVNIKNEHFVCLIWEPKENKCLVLNSLRASYSEDIQKYIPGIEISEKNFAHQDQNDPYQRNSCLIYALYYAVFEVLNWPYEGRPNNEMLRAVRIRLPASFVEDFEDIDFEIDDFLIRNIGEIKKDDPVPYEVDAMRTEKTDEPVQIKEEPVEEKEEPRKPLIIRIPVSALPAEPRRSKRQKKTTRTQDFIYD